MNWVQIALFFVYCLSVLSAGIAVYRFLNPRLEIINRTLYLGESLLLGSILVIGELLLLSLVHLYKASFLWGVVILNFIFLLIPSVRQGWKVFGAKKLVWDVPLVVFFLLIGFFFFRNCYFLIDVDSHSTYLYAQKLWLEHGTSIFASPALDIKIFTPHFNAVPYGLGLALFPYEPLFPHLIVAFWTIIVVLLVFGYVTYRFGRLYALCAVMLCLFNDHVFYSGELGCCIINSALIALFFASAYNFWESRSSANIFRFVLALIFLSQVMANKYQMFYAFVFLFITGALISQNIRGYLRGIFKDPRYLIGLLVSAVICSLWYLKNFLATGCPTFPILAGEMGALNWTPEMAKVFNKVFGGPLTADQIFKFFTYMFVWPGVYAAKLMGKMIALLPFVFLLALIRKNFNQERLKEVCFWIWVSFITIWGICLVSFLDPRHYRYGIAVMAVAVIFSLDFLLRDSLRLPKKLIPVIVFFVAVQNWSVPLHQRSFDCPSMADNIAVLKNQLQMKNLIFYHYPNNVIVFRDFRQNLKKFLSGAWDTGNGGATGLSAYLLPTRPQVGLWYTSVVGWKSYEDPQAIVDDLHREKIYWIMRVTDGKLVFESAEEYAQRAVGFDRYPKELFYNYDFPKELAEVHY